MCNNKNNTCTVTLAKCHVLSRKQVSMFYAGIICMPVMLPSPMYIHCQTKYTGLHLTLMSHTLSRSINKIHELVIAGNIN